MAVNGGRFWHGGIPDLKPGDLLLPPAETGNTRQVEKVAAMVARYPGLNPDDVLPDDRATCWVYLTTQRNVAMAYAAGSRLDYGRGALYVVEPIGPVEADPDMPLQGIRARSARITTVYDPCVRISDARAKRLFAAAVAFERGITAKEQIRAMDRYVSDAMRSPVPVQAITLSPERP